MNLPRIMIAAPCSGAGKTTVTCGILHALARRGLAPSAFKCGPDYIDPMFHRSVQGVPSYNLDLFFTSEGTATALLVRGASGTDIAVMEGVMGYYDGLEGSDAIASAYHVARATETPVVLVVDARGAALSLAATVRGFQTLRPDSRIAAVLLNRATENGYRVAKPLIESECGIPVLGYLPHDETFSLESRHLGLVSAAEVEGLRDKIARVAAVLEQHMDIDTLLAIARGAAPVHVQTYSCGPAVQVGHRPRIAVADDRAFCFYYQENLDMLTDLGADIVRFSPMDDAALPAHADALYFGGGYPELYAERLASNETMRNQVRVACAQGTPIFAECGGFLYLQQTLRDAQGIDYPMVGAIPGHAYWTGKLTRFGYVELSAQRDTLLCGAGETIPAHEFHYYDSEANGDAFIARKPKSGRSWPCFAAQGNVLAGFPHLYFPANPLVARRFVEAAACYAHTKVCDVR